jgi:pimeloyl-ACP methyl ester carboxylesterase
VTRPLAEAGRWFDVIERDPLVRRLLGLPLPIAPPLLLIWGTRDRMVPHAGAQILLEALPQTHVELLEGVGHCPQIEATDRLLELLLPFPAAVRA